MTGYHTDFALWAEEQAALLRAGMLNGLDRENLAGELDGLARALRRELDARLARLLQNLLQWELSGGDQRPAWYAAIQEERSTIPRLLTDAPSLCRHWPQTLARAWLRALDDAAAMSGLPRQLLPLTCPFTPGQILDVAFWPA